MASPVARFEGQTLALCGIAFTALALLCLFAFRYAPVVTGRHASLVSAKRTGASLAKVL